MKRNISKFLKPIIILTLIAMLFSGCGTSDTNSSQSSVSNKVYKWRLVTHQLPNTARYTSTIVPFAEAVKKASGGRLIIEPYGAGILFPVADSLDSVKNGIVEMAAVWSGYWAGKDPFFALAASIPADPIANYSQHYYRSEKLNPLITQVYKKYGVTCLGGFDFGPNEILMTVKPIEKLADFKGITIRTGGIGGEFYAKLGASTVSLSAPEIYQALQLRTVDAAEYNDWIVNSEMGLHEVTKYVIEPVLHTGPIDDKVLIVNPKAWSELPQDLQEIVLNAMDVARFKSASAYEAAGIIAKNKYLKSGAKIITLSQEDVKQARKVASDLLKAYEKKSPECAEFIKIYSQVLNDLGYEEEAKNLGYTK